MRGSNEARHRVWAVASAQHGAVALDQMLACGMSRRQVEVAIARSELRRLHQAVYLVGPLTTMRTAAMAAVLACRPEAALSHISAAHLYGFLPQPSEPVPQHVTVSGRHRVGDSGIVVHEADAIDPVDRTVFDSIPVTAPELTLIDIAAKIWPTQLERALAEAFALGRVERGGLSQAIRRFRGRRGVARLRILLDLERPARTRSAPEWRLLRLIREHGLPEPEANVRVGMWEVDLLWREHQLVVEVDAYGTHSSPRAFERDRRKSAELEDEGLRVHRVTARQIRDQPTAVVSRIRRRLHEPHQNHA